MNVDNRKKRKEIEVDDPFEYGRSLLESAKINFQEAEFHKGKHHWPQVVHSSQQCIELSVKAVACFISGKIIPVHRLDDEAIMSLHANKPLELTYVDLPRIYIIQKLWATFYEESKYGKEKFGLGPEKLFTELEAEFALQHAEIAKRHAWWVFDYYQRSDMMKS